MKARETNRKILFTFILCSASIVVVSWTVSEKFFPSTPLVAFLVNLGIALFIGWLYERYLEGRFNASADFLVSKISRVAKGDLTQVFKEDPDDIMPYGLSFELGQMMKYFRENIGKLWRTSSLLVKQLNLFIGSAREVLAEFRREVQYLSEVREGLENVRRDMAEMVKALSEVKVNVGTDITMMLHVGRFAQASAGHIVQSKDILKEIRERVTNLRDSMSHFESLLRGFTELSRNTAMIEKTMSDLTTQANLVKLNAAIDSTQAHGGGENYSKLVEETRKIVDNITALSQESGTTTVMGEERINDFVKEVEERRSDLTHGLYDIQRSFALVEAISDTSAAAAAGYTQVSEHVKNLNDLLLRMDAQAAEFALMVRLSEGRFDKLYSDTNMTLMKFNELGSRIDAIEDNLKQLEEFNRLFDIG